MINDSLLDWLGDHFVNSPLSAKGWTFEQFVWAYQNHYIEVAENEHI
ncbi:hypothetical protein P9B03_04065 [Metasolibacillus meyeri]|uniref:YozE SAM-like domain-containing protein n=1 Tax=Metasolibacillus meyeri TaxID=1071052 RepID=A0AAW9NNS1_9BACL|nr:hypothetical protein [Metasolibacillus meyeri]MEC1177650.1 hypothetical protein [Metasolibacillus meyeri]